MSEVKVTCPDCGNVVLTSEQIRLVKCTVAAWSYYEFRCPECNELVRKDAGADIVSLLASAGIPTELWVVPSEALERHAGPAISYDDVLDFALRIADADVIAVLEITHG
jgi:predicted RNA-binding Zn-ribbon protein involved in translation (DUF1610 family)